jgi:hypothetical protein
LDISSDLKMQLLCELDPFKRLERIDALIGQIGDATESE